MGLFFNLFLRICKEKNLKPDSELIERLPRTDVLLLDLSHMSLSAGMCDVLSEVLTFDETIIELRFCDCMICSEGMQALLSGLSSNTSVQKLNIKGNQIRGETVESLGYMLRNNNTLISLCLEWNDLGLLETPFIALCDSLQANSTLKRLDLRNNQITHHGVKQLAEALTTNKTLQILDLKWNKVGLSGGRALLDLLHVNKTLLTIDLGGNDIPCDIVHSIESCLQCNQKLQLMKTNCQHKTHLLCKQYRMLETENKQQLLNLKDKLSKSQDYLNLQKRSSCQQLLHLKETLKSKNEAFNKLFSKFVDFSKAFDSVDQKKMFDILKPNGVPDRMKSSTQTTSKSVMTQTETELTLMKQKNSNQGDYVLRLEEQLCKLKSSFQTELGEAREDFYTKEKNLLKDLNKANSRNIQLESKLSDSEAKLQAVQEQVYELKENIAYLHSETELKETQNKDIIEQKKKEFNEKIKQVEENYRKKLLQQKAEWQDLEKNLRNQIYKMTQDCSALEKNTASLKTAYSTLKNKTEEDMVLFKTNAKSENDLIREQFQNKIHMIESSREDIKMMWESSQQQIVDMNNKLAAKEGEKEAEIGKYKIEMLQLQTKLDSATEIQRELKNKLSESEQKLSEQDTIYKQLIKKHEIELTNLNDQLRTRGSQLHCLCDEVAQRAQSLQSAISMTRTSIT